MEKLQNVKQFYISFWKQKYTGNDEQHPSTNDYKYLQN